MKNKKINFIKLGIFFFGISLLLSSCENESSFIQSETSVPTVLESKSFLLNNSNSLKAKNSNTFINKINWDNSTKINYKENTELLFSPIQLNTNKGKSFVASIKIKEEIDNRIITLQYDNTSNQQTFSGTLFVHNKEGKLTEFYKYINGKKETKHIVKEPVNTYQSKTNSDYDCYDLNYLLWLIENTDENIVLLPCFSLNASISTEDSGGSNDSSWQEPSDFFDNGDDDINNDNLGGGGSWYTSNCGDGFYFDLNIGTCVEKDDQIFLDPSFENSFANCAYNLLTENNLLKDILKQLIPKDSEYDVTFKVGNSSGNGGNTSATYGVNGDIIVTINKDLVDTGNIVSISETILHEAVHAKLFEMVKSIGGLDKLNEFTNEDSEIGRLAACYNKYGKPELQHEFIWSNYVDEIAKGTEIIHKLFPDNYNQFHSYMTGTNGYDKNTFYKKVTQAGLSKTSYFKSLKNDTINVLNMYSKLKANGKKITNYKTCK